MAPGVRICLFYPSVVFRPTYTLVLMSLDTHVFTKSSHLILEPFDPQHIFVLYGVKVLASCAIPVTSLARAVPVASYFGRSATDACIDGTAFAWSRRIHCYREFRTYWMARFFEVGGGPDGDAGKLHMSRGSAAESTIGNGGRDIRPAADLGACNCPARTPCIVSDRESHVKVRMKMMRIIRQHDLMPSHRKVTLNPVRTDDQSAATKNTQFGATYSLIVGAVLRSRSMPNCPVACP